MSSLAFDKQGKAFTFNPRTRKLLVRLFRNPGGRGTCCAVLDDDGERVFLDVDADYADLRREAGGVPGLYRLDQCDDDGREIESATPAYVSIDAPRNAASIDIDPRDAVIRDLSQTNAEMAKAALAHNTTMMHAAADLVRAYVPPPPQQIAAVHPSGHVASPEVVEDEDEEDDEDETVELPPPSPWTSLIKALEPMLPALGAFLYQRVSEIVKQYMQGQLTSSPAAVSVSSPVSTPTDAPSSTAGHDSTGTAAGPSATTPGTPAAPPPAPSVAATASATSPSVGSVAPEPPPAATSPDVQPRNAQVMPTPEQLALLYAVRSRLSPKEAAIAEAAIARMPHDLLARWMLELASLSTEDAVERVRTVIAQAQLARVERD